MRHLRLMCTADNDEVLVDLQLTADSPQRFLELAAAFLAELVEPVPAV